MAEDDEPRPGLIILDMSNDQMKDVKYNRTPVIDACRQLANSDFFHIVIDCKAFVPKFRQNTKGAKLVDGLTGLDHLKAIPKKNESALDGTTVLDTLKELQITHVCLCGSSTDTSIYATVKDLYENQFNIFVVRDAVSSKAGKIGHEKGLRKIESEFGAGIVVGLEDLLGEEADAGEPEVVEEVAAPPAPAQAPKGVEPAKPAPPIAAKARSYPPPGGGVKVSKTMEPIKVGGHIPEPKPLAPPAANPDGDVLAARKKQVEAARFADIEKKNKIAQEKAAAAKKEEEERLAVQHGRAPPPPGPPPAADTGPAPVPAPAAQQASASESAPPAKKEKKKSFLGGLFGGKKKKDKQKANETASTPPPAAAAAPPAPEPPAPAPAPPPPPAPAPAPPPVTTAPQQQQQSNAEKEQYVYPRPENSKTAPAPKPAEPKPEAPKAPWMKPQEKKQFPAYTGGARTTATPSTGLQEKMKGLQSGGLSMTNPAQRRMKTPKIVTDTKETWDRDGNITRHITRYITEVDGTKRTEKETVHIPAKK